MPPIRILRAPRIPIRGKPKLSGPRAEAPLSRADIIKQEPANYSGAGGGIRTRPSVRNPTVVESVSRFGPKQGLGVAIATTGVAAGITLIKGFHGIDNPLTFDPSDDPKRKDPSAQRTILDIIGQATGIDPGLLALGAIVVIIAIGIGFARRR